MLQKLELRKFNGGIKQWLPFRSQFDKIDKNSIFENTDTFQYLLQAIVEGQRAGEEVESFTTTVENNSKAIGCLKEHFEYLFIEVYMRKQLKLVLNNDTQTVPTNLSALYNNLET